MGVVRFYDKTRNDWSERASFEKVAGKYDLVKIDYSAGQNVEMFIYLKIALFG